MGLFLLERHVQPLLKEKVEGMIRMKHVQAISFGI